MPSIASACTVSRATVRLTPYALTISSDDGNASPTAIRPETISAASSVESCCAQPLGLAQPSLRPQSVSRHRRRPRRQLKAGEMPLEQHPRATRRARPAGGRRRVVLEHAALDEDRAWRRRCSGRSSAASRRRASAGSRANRSSASALVAARLGLVDADEQIDEVDAGDDPGGAGCGRSRAGTCRRRRPRSRTRRRARRSSGSSRPGRPRASRAGRSPQPRRSAATTAGAEPDAQIRGRVLDHHRAARRRPRCGRSSRRARPRRRRRSVGAGTTTQLAPAASAWRASSIDARTLGAPTPTNTGTAPPTSSTITSVSCRRSSAESFSTSPASPNATMPCAPHVEGEADDPPLRLEVHGVVLGERRADRGIDPAPLCPGSWSTPTSP